MKPIHQIFGAIAGWALGGPIGAFLVSFGLIHVSSMFKAGKDNESKFTSSYGDLALSVLVLFKWVSYVDGKLQKEERIFIKSFLLKEFGIEAVDAGINAFASINTKPNLKEVTKISKQIKKHTQLEERVQLIDSLFRLANADSVINTKEEQRVHQIAQHIGLPEAEYLRLKAMYIFERKSSQKTSYARTRKTRLSNAYQILSIDSDCTEMELKKSFRSLAKEHHPDKFAHMGKQASALAEERFEKILAAYELIKTKRGFN